MSRDARQLKRKAYFVDEQAVRRAQRVLGSKTASEAIRAAVEFIAEMDEFWRFMRRSRGTVPRGGFERP